MKLSSTATAPSELEPAAKLILHSRNGKNFNNEEALEWWTSWLAANNDVDGSSWWDRDARQRSLADHDIPINIIGGDYESHVEF